jgi:hypothetical protein
MTDLPEEDRKLIEATLPFPSDYRSEDGLWTFDDDYISRLLAAARAEGELKAAVDESAARGTTASLPATPSPAGWRPIDGAPKDGALIDLWVHWPEDGSRSRVHDAYWNAEKGEWQLGPYHAGQFVERPEVLGWMPAPDLFAAPPAESGLAGSTEPQAKECSERSEAEPWDRSESPSQSEHLRVLREALEKIANDDLDEPATWGGAAEWMRDIARAALKASEAKR